MSRRSFSDTSIPNPTSVAALTEVLIKILSVYPVSTAMRRFVINLIASSSS
jgi:hypothetical protein